MTQHLNPDGLPGNPAFTQVVVVTPPAKMVYIGGQDAVDASGRIVGPGDVKAQTEQVLQNLQTALQAAGPIPRPSASPSLRRWPTPLSWWRWRPWPRFPCRRQPVASKDLYNLERFLAGQAPVYTDALAELRAGQKRTHWMWFVFPQLAGLGHSSTSLHYGIKGLEEARAYLEHPILGPRLVECAEALLAIEGRTASQIFPYPDDLKLRSCMTLFDQVADFDSAFARVLEKYFQGRRDERTQQLLKRG